MSARSSKTNRQVSELSSAAGSFCLAGALYRAASHESYWMAGERIREALVGLSLPSSIVRFNDNPNTTFANVKRVLNRAIEIEQGKK